MVKLFVYGSLKRGFSAHQLLKDCGAEFLNEATTHARYHLVKVSWYPGMVEGEEGSGVQGELYEVPDVAIQLLDRYEGTPQLFTRNVIQLADGSEAVAYLYARDVSDYAVVADGRWGNGDER
jgi:gamma-glutamylcyclotransferase (GGCT)/AIG2-like uncharacterized protein YtfP